MIGFIAFQLARVVARSRLWKDLKTILLPVIKLPSFNESPDSYKDYGSDSNFVAKTAKGECAA